MSPSVTPAWCRRTLAYTAQLYDRWGNVTLRSAGGYTTPNGEYDPSPATTTTYAYNHDNQLIAEHLPRSAATRTDGSFYETFVTHELGTTSGDRW